MTDDLDKLKRDAEAADQGHQWGVEQTDRVNWVGPLRNDGSGKIKYIVVHIVRDSLTVEARRAGDADATHIANMDPPTTKRLITRLERAEAALRVADAVAAEVDRCSLYGPADVLREKVKRYTDARAALPEEIDDE